MILMALSFSAIAEPEPAIADNGREVILKPDGTWAFVGEDRFATTADGTRIRLKPDGSWEPANQADADRYGFSQEGGFSHDQATLDDLKLSLESVVIETARMKRGKNAIESSQMIFTVEIESTDPESTAKVLPLLSIDAFSVTDSLGQSYETASVRPNGDRRIKVFVDDSPAFMWRLKHFRLTVARSVFNSGEAVVLTKVKGDVIERDVEELSAQN